MIPAVFLPGGHSAANIARRCRVRVCILRARSGSRSQAGAGHLLFRGIFGASGCDRALPPARTTGAKGDCGEAVTGILPPGGAGWPEPEAGGWCGGVSLRKVGTGRIRRQKPAPGHRTGAGRPTGTAFVRRKVVRMRPGPNRTRKSADCSIRMRCHTVPEGAMAALFLCSIFLLES